MGKLNIETVDRNILGNRRTVAGEATLSADYFNDSDDADRGVGETGLNKKYFGFDSLSFVQFDPGQVSLRYDRNTERVRVFLYDDSGSGTGPADEVTDGEDLSAYTFTFYAIGI